MKKVALLLLFCGLLFAQPQTPGCSVIVANPDGTQRVKPCGPQKKPKLVQRMFSALGRKEVLFVVIVAAQLIVLRVGDH